MFVELIELLRCPRPHEETPLIASASRTEARHIIDGVLGCPVCHAEFAIERGITRFAAAELPVARVVPSAEAAMRIAAFLDLAEARGYALLFGRWGAHADEIRRLADASLVVVNPTAEIDADVAGTLIVADAVPFARSSALAAALDSGVGTALAGSAVRAVRNAGRLIGPAALALPEGVTELVRDDHLWVGEKTAAPDSAPRLTALQRGKR